MPEQIKVRGARVHNLKSIDVDVPLNQIVAIAGVSGSGKSTLVPDESLSIDDGAVAPWQTLMWSLMKDIAREMGVRTDVPFRELTPEERDIVFHGPAVKKNIIYQNKTSGAAGDMDFTYFNATYTVENALSKVKDEKGMKRVEKFLKQGICPDCGGTRLFEAARAPRLRGISLDEACKMSLSELVEWVAGVPASLPSEMRPMAESICQSFQTVAKRLMDLGLGYLSLDRAASTLSTGERQRMQLARAVRNRTTGILYVLDEPSIGLHPSNIVGLTGVMHDLVADGNSVILVDHDTQILSEADWLIEMGPEAGAIGGWVVAQGTISDITQNKNSQIGPFLAGTADIHVRDRARPGELFDLGTIHLSTEAIHTVMAMDVNTALEVCKDMKLVHQRLQVLQDLGLTAKELFVLDIIWFSEGGCLQSEISERLSATKQTISAIVKKFWKLGYLSLTESPTDRRNKIVRFTKAGRDYAEKIIPPAAKAEVDAMAELDLAGEDIAELVRLTTLFSNQMAKKFSEIKED